MFPKCDDSVFGQKVKVQLRAWMRPRYEPGHELLEGDGDLFPLVDVD